MQLPRRSSSRAALTTDTAVKGGVFKAFELEKKAYGLNSRKSFVSGFATQHLSLATSGFPSMWKHNRLLSWFSIGTCLLLSLLFVLATINSTATKTVVPESTSTSLTRSPHVRFDNYSLILRGQRIFL